MGEKVDRVIALQQRTKTFALTVIEIFRRLPRTEEARVLGKQLLRAGTSVAANYRAACRARSKAEFVAKIGIVVEEVDEVVFWLELIAESMIMPGQSLKPVLCEANELLSIFSASHSTARKNTRPQSPGHSIPQSHS